MRVRSVIAGVLVVAVALGMAAGAAAQTPARKVIDVTMTSYVFDPKEIRVGEGDVVVIRLRNIDPQGRRHNLASTWLMDIPLTVRGDATQGTSGGRRWVAVDAGKAGEFEFVAKGPGSHQFLCSLFNHAERGQTGTFVVAASN
jgi:plastocyanin